MRLSAPRSSFDYGELSRNAPESRHFDIFATLLKYFESCR